MKSTPRLIVTTGPESSGKTTLANELAGTLKAPLVSELSRDYLNARYKLQPDYQYQPDDLLQIAKQQHAAEQGLLAQGSKLIVCDTDLLVIIIWSQVKYGTVDAWIVDAFKDSLRNTQRYYLLCDHEIPWQYDPLRENPNDRHLLAARYAANLHDYACNNMKINGTRDQRLALSMQWLTGEIGLQHLSAPPA